MLSIRSAYCLNQRKADWKVIKGTWLSIFGAFSSKPSLSYKILTQRKHCWYLFTQYPVFTVFYAWSAFGLLNRVSFEQRVYTPSSCESLTVKMRSSQGYTQRPASPGRFRTNRRHSLWYAYDYNHYQCVSVKKAYTYNIYPCFCGEPAIIHISIGRFNSWVNC